MAPSESGGGDSNLVAASIYAVAGADFSVSANDTNLVFSTGVSEAAVERLRLDADGPNIPSGDDYSINGTSVLSATVLGSGVTTASGLVTVSTLNSGAISSGFGNIDIGSSTLSATGTITGPSGTWDAGGIDIATTDTYAIAGTNVIDNATTLTSTMVTSSLTTVGVLNSGSITSGFGNIDIGSSTIGATGTITGPSGTWDAGGMDIASSDSYAINSVDKLTATEVILAEQTDASAPGAGFGRIWVRDDVAPNVLIFTDDADTDNVVNFGGGGGDVTASGSPLNNEVAVFATGTDINSDSTFSWDGSLMSAPAITATGDVTVGNLIATGDTASADPANIGQTAAEGIIITGQGSTSDVTLKNDADVNVLTIPTGTNTVVIHGPAGTGSATAGVLELVTEELTVVANDELGRIDFFAPAETGADALLVAASIKAIAQVAFDATNNDTDLEFYTAVSEAAVLRLTLDADGPNIPSGDDYSIAGSSVLNATTLGGAVVASSLTSVGTMTSLDSSGDISGANFIADGDVAANDPANIGYTAAEGLILTGQGSTNDITVLNDAHASVLHVLTGTTGVVFDGTVNMSAGTVTGPSGTWDTGGIDIATTDTYAIAGTDVFTSATELTSTVVTSALTAVGTVATGTWEATDVGIAHGGTGSSTAAGARTNLGALGSATKGITIADPIVENLGFFHTPVAITVTNILTYRVGGTSVTLNFWHDTTATGTTNQLWASDEVITSTTGEDITSFTDATIPADSYIRLEVSAVSGSVDEWHLTMEYTED